MEIQVLEYTILIGAILLWVGGMLGSFLPVLPGPPLIMGAILCTIWTPSILQFQEDWFFGLILLGAIVFVLDYILPAKLVKRYGGTKSGSWGAFIGGLAGAFVFGWLVTPFIGIPLFTFLGAYIGETLAKQSGNDALRSAFGSFIGFMIGVGMKIMYGFLVIAVALYSAF